MTPLIDVDGLWRIAEKQAGISLPPVRGIHVDGLRCLASAMERGGSYDAAALRLLKREIFAWILAYLSFARDRELFGGIPDVPIRQPLFVVGFGRTGSTLLHNLLALDGNARTPLLWELWAPSPPPRPDSYATDARIEIVQRRLDLFARAAPPIRQIHPMMARAPDECHWMMRHSLVPVMMYRVPEYWTWLKHLGVEELRELYAHYRLQVQHLQLFCRGSHWVTKSSTHLHYYPVLRDVFPDANVVRLHRHPCQAVPSLCSLSASYRRIILANRLDPSELGETILDMFVDGMGRMVRSRDAASRVVDIRYDRLVADPLGVVRGIYRQFGYSYSAAFEQGMRQYVESQRAATRPRHLYSLEQFGLSRAAVVDRSAEYLAWVQQAGIDLAEA
jgi:hypothetical protein